LHLTKSKYLKVGNITFQQCTKDKKHQQPIIWGKKEVATKQLSKPKNQEWE
jgi:hypothetical protein